MHRRIATCTRRWDNGRVFARTLVGLPPEANRLRKMSPPGLEWTEEAPEATSIRIAAVFDRIETGSPQS